MQLRDLTDLLRDHPLRRFLGLGAEHRVDWMGPAKAIVVLFGLGAVAIALLGAFGRMQEWLAPLLGALLGGKSSPLLYFTSMGALLLFCAAGIWTLRRWLRCRLWQPTRVTQELLFALFLLPFGGELLHLIYVAAEGAYPVWFAPEAGFAHKIKLALLLLLGRGSVLLSLVWLYGVLLLIASYALAPNPMRQWCPFGRMARRVAAVTLGLLPLCGIAQLFDHVARMHWKFNTMDDMYSGSPSTTVSLDLVVLFAVYVIAVACIVYTAGRLYQDRLLRRLAFLPALVFLLLLGGIASGVLYPVLR